MSDAELTRRALLNRAAALAGVAVVPGLVGACGGSEDGGGGGGSAGTSGTPDTSKWPEITSKEVVVSGFGGLTYQVRRQIEFNAFTAKSGAKVIEAPWDYGKFVAMVDSDKPEWDMIDFDGFSMVGLLEGGSKLAKLEPWVRRCDLVDKEYQDYAAGSYAYSVTLGWTDKVGGTPAGWADLFDTEKFPGKRAFPKSIYAGTLELALLADGVPKEQIQPIDFDRAFKKLDTIKGDLLFYDSYAQGQQYITQGSATMIVTANSRCEQLKTQGGFDYTFKDAILYPWGAFPMPANLPHPDAANALIDWMSSPQMQAAVAKQLLLGPNVSEAFDALTEEELAKTPNSPANREQSYTIKTAQAAKQDADYAKKYADWVAS
jgi:putative spermidine/putrescine transport system substrate-binding protein